MSNLEPCLEKCLGDNNEERQKAEQYLKNARNQNLALFITSLTIIMASEDKSKSARQMAGIILKNELRGHSDERSKQLAQNWKQLDQNLKNNIRVKVSNTLHSGLYEVRKISARVLAAIATIDLNHNEWADVIQLLQKNITQPPSENGIDSSLMAIGYLCEQCDSPILEQHANVLLTAVIHGMRSQNSLVKLAATEALYNCLEFAESSFQKKEHRDFIVKCILENSIWKDEKVRRAALECIVQIALKYYEYIGFYFPSLCQVTLKIAQDDKELVAMQAVEFWTTLSEVEADILEEERECRELRRQSKRKCFNFVKSKLPELCKLLTNKLTLQSEDVDNWDISSASGTCLSLVSHTVGDSIVKHVINFITSNLKNNDWHYREAAILAFSAIVDGPKSDNMIKLIHSAIPNLLGHVKDQSVVVRDTTVFCLGRIAKFQPMTLKDQYLENTIKALLFAMNDQSQKVVEKACWSIDNIAKIFDREGEEVTSNPLSKHFQIICEQVLKVTSRNDIDDGNLRIHSYDCLASLILITTPDNYQYLGHRITGIVIERLKETLSQSGGNKEKLFTIQGLLCGTLQNITEKLGDQMQKFADTLMRIYLSILKIPGTNVQDDVLSAICALCTAIGSDFIKYMDAFFPFLMAALRNQRDDKICSAAIWTVSDLAYAVKKNLFKYTDDIVRQLLNNLQSNDSSRDIKPLLISCFGDIAMGIGDNFQKYVVPVAIILKKASDSNVDRDDEELVEYLNVLRENILSAYIGILQGVKRENRTIFNPFVKPLINFIGVVFNDKQTDQEVLNKACSAVGDLVNVYGPKCKDYLAYPFIKNLITYCGQSQDKETKRIANWTKKQINEHILGN